MKPIIENFESDKEAVVFGDEVTLSWEVNETNGVFLDGDAFKWRQVEPVGRSKSTPLKYPRTTYKLSAKNTGEISLGFDIKDSKNETVTDFAYTVEIDKEKREFHGAEKHPKILEVDKGLYNFIVSERNGIFHRAEEQGEVL